MSMYFHLSVKSKRQFCKLEEDLADGLFILPNWPTAVCCPQMMRLLTAKTDLDTEGERTLQLMYSDSDHLLHPRLQLLAVTLSGKPSKHKDFMDELRRSSKTLGDNLLNANIYRTLRDGKCPVLETNVHLSITYLPGKLNAEADEQSKKFNEQTEWKLNPKVKKKKNGSKSIPFDQL